MVGVHDGAAVVDAAALCEIVFLMGLESPSGDADVTARGGEALECVGGRYELQALLGEGGMASVYRALDTATGARVGLKRLKVDHTGGSMALRFRREFQTLKGLQHPRIVAAYDYGVEGSQAFYTMELLEGGDLRDLAPVEPLRACVMLRDVASALALLHSRKLLHRDVSPRNVRATREGVAKLIDFGALSTLGAMSHEIVGTPSCVAPEVLAGAALDQRTDLFALGAVAYWLLTGLHAFPAKELADAVLRHVVKPPPPSRYEAKIPAALDDLVLSLLSIDPLGRPSAAAEVIDRLGAIEGLPPAPDLEVARSYVHSTSIAGRERELAVLWRVVSRAASGRGRCVVLRGRSGSGKTRLLREIACEAQLAGAVVASAAGRALDGAPYAVLRDLLLVLYAGAPSEMSAAVAAHPLIGRVFPDLVARAGVIGGHAPSMDPAADRVEHRLELQSALAACVFEVASRRPVALLVDDLQRCDESSAAVLAALAAEARGRSLLIAATTRTDEEWRAPVATQRIHDRAFKLRLRSLNAREIEALARGTFGDIPRLSVLADWMLRSCGGGPLECTELLRHLVDRRIVRYVEGIWAIPDELDEQHVPHALHEAMDARIRVLTPEAFELGQLLAVHGGDVPLERCAALAGTSDEAEVFSALDVLVREEILVGSADAYRFRHDSLREALLRTLDGQERARIELRVGRILGAARAISHELEAEVGWHLVRGGELGLGADLLEKAGRRLFSTTSFSDAIGPLAAALEVFEKSEASSARCFEIRQMLLEAGYNTNRALALKHGESLIADLSGPSGVALAGRLARALGARAGLLLGVLAVTCRHAATPRVHKGPRPLDALRMYAASVIHVSGVAAWSNDWATQLRSEKLARPLEVVAPGIGDIIGLSLNFNLGRFQTVRSIAARLLVAMPARNWLTDEQKRLLEGAIRHTLAHVAILRAEREEFFEQLRRLDAIDTATWRLGSLILRTDYHLSRGEEELARPFAERAERESAQLGAIWHLDSNRYIGPAMAHAGAEHMLELKRNLQALAMYVEAGFGFEAPRDIAHAEYLSLRGESQAADELLRRALDILPPGEGYQRPWAMSALADVWLRAREWRRAAEIAASGLRLAEDPEHAQMVFRGRLLRTLALAEAQLGDAAGAIARLDRMLFEIESLDQPLVKGTLCEARAFIALESKDFDAYQVWTTQADALLRATRNPALIARVDRLSRPVSVARAVEHPPSRDNADSSTTVRERLSPSTTQTLQPDGSRS